MNRHDPETPTVAEAVAELAHDAETGNHRRDRLLSGLVLLMGLGVLLAAPFALQAGSAFFLPVISALVIGLVLIPLLEWLERRGLPSGGAALLAVALFVAVANAILVAIVIPGIDWLQLLPGKLGQARANIEPLIDTFGMAERFVAKVGRGVGLNTTVESAMLGLPTVIAAFASAAPVALLQVLFTLLLAYFALTSYAGVRDEILQGAGRQSGSMRLARLVREVVRHTAAYILTISVVNVGVGAAVALMAWAFGLPTPLMWGGFAALFNFIPYAGPLATGLVLLIGGLVTFDSPLGAMLPALAFLGLHLVEANFITPALVGRRLTMSPLAILIALSFWGWVWGAIGALLSVPLLIMGRVFLHHVGTPDIMGFLFRDGTLVREPHEDEGRGPTMLDTPRAGA